MHAAGARRLIPHAMRFLYKSLAEDEIRLLTVHTKYLRYGAIVSAELHTYSRAAAPPYDAVSYAWGDDVSTASMMVNGLSLTIRTTLLEALPYIIDSRPEPRTRALWIDAICPNQNDDQEKAIHVLRMNEIYEMASRTLIWLGKADNYSNLAMDSIEGLTRKLLLVKDPKTLSQPELLAKYDLPRESDPMWEAIRVLQLRPWFSRLWTLQEVVLSEQPILLCGRNSMAWDTLVALDDAAGQALLSAMTQGEMDATYQYSGTPAEVDFLRASRQAQNKLDLSSLIASSRRRGYSVPVDRVWALLGMLDQKYRQHILDEKLVDYSKSAIINYHETFLGIMKFHVKHHRRIAMKLIEGNLRDTRNPSLPSWCPDWHPNHGHFSLSEQTEALAGFPGGVVRHIEPFMQVNEDNSLELCGLVVDTVDRVTTSACQDIIDPESCAWIAECLDISTEVEVVQYDIYPESFSLAPVHSFYPEEYQELMRLEQILAHVLYPQTHDLSSADMLACNDRKFFRTKAGRLGIGPTDLKSNDILCAMYGASTFWALRPRHKACSRQRKQGLQFTHFDIEQEAFELLGCVHTPSLSKGQAWMGTSCESMFRFKIT